MSSKYPLVLSGSSVEEIQTGDVVPTDAGGTGLASFTSGGAVYASSTSALTTGTLPVASGGTGLATTTAYSVVFTGTTSTGAFQASSGPGTSGYVLTSNGAGALPTWEAAGGGGITTGKSIAMAMIFGF